MINKSIVVFITSLMFAGCFPCKDPPSVYKGAVMNGSYGGPGYICYTYANRGCDYTLCQYDGCGMDWELDSWYCW